ncbi:MAG: hypothetical protein IPK73_01070 [Candidatus Obscuribacter sp.]|nr:hypothetical protein [Candidatus Obscuribacter sp.]MBK9280410.1 hypothetical protein [Candidatus Obscuribacter sp.]
MFSQRITLQALMKSGSFIPSPLLAPLSVGLLQALILSPVFCAGAGSAPEPAPAAVLNQARVKMQVIQIESSVNGPYKILVNKDHLRIDSSSFGLTIYAASPDWQVTAVRPNQKELATASYAQWQKTVVPSFTMAGICKELGTPTSSKKGADGITRNVFMHKGNSLSFFQTREERTEIKSVEIDSQPVDTSPQALAIINHFLNLPNLPGVPVAINVFYANGTKAWQIKRVSTTTLELKKSEVLPPKAAFRNVGLISRQFLARTVMNTLDDVSDLLSEPK